MEEKISGLYELLDPFRKAVCLYRARRENEAWIHLEGLKTEDARIPLLKGIIEEGWGESGAVAEAIAKAAEIDEEFNGALIKMVKCWLGLSQQENLLPGF